ncbi:hypothetical protein VTJ83DRAFT_4238 [Remersonia thermophila]|uniref:Uncharacterized protein n=1 Tax=Remersonia thermophila TaxID=72144 RepID=A0ABR4DAW3_9PEZI
MPRTSGRVNGEANGDIPHHNNRVIDFPSLFASPSPSQHHQNGVPISNANTIDLGPFWTSLAPGVQYAIAHSFAQQGPLSQGLMSLNLAHAEIVGLLHLIHDERRKHARLDGLLLPPDPPRDGAQPSLARLQDLMPVTESLPAFQVAQGQRFLRARGMEDAADRLAGWVGTGGRYHPIDIDAGLAGFLADLRSREDDGEGGGGGGGGGGASEKAAKQRREAARHLLRMDGRELLVRLDPPPETVNPQRVGSGAGPRASPSGGGGGGGGATADTMEGLKVLSQGLHPANYCVVGPSGNRYSVLDGSDWPDWEAVRALGGISDGDLGWLTGEAVVSDAVNCLGFDELMGLGALDHAGGDGNEQSASGEAELGSQAADVEEEGAQEAAKSDETGPRSMIKDAAAEPKDDKETAEARPEPEKDGKEPTNETYHDPLGMEVDIAQAQGAAEEASHEIAKDNAAMEAAVTELINAMAGAVPFDERCVDFEAIQPPDPGLMWGGGDQASP